MVQTDDTRVVETFVESVKSIGQLYPALEQVWNEVLERFDKQQMATHLKKARSDAQTWMQSRKKKLD
jgi:hypothetical protein